MNFYNGKQSENYMWVCTVGDYCSVHSLSPVVACFSAAEIKLFLWLPLLFVMLWFAARSPLAFCNCFSLSVNYVTDNIPCAGSSPSTDKERNNSTPTKYLAIHSTREIEEETINNERISIHSDRAHSHSTTSSYGCYRRNMETTDTHISIHTTNSNTHITAYFYIPTNCCCL